VRPIYNKLTHYFPWSCENGTYSRKCALGHVTPNLCFCIRCDPVGHILHYGASGTRNVDALFFFLGWDRYALHKIVLGHLTLNLCFASGGTYRSRGAFLSLRGAKPRCTIFRARAGLARFHKKHVGTSYVELLFLYPLGYICGSRSAFRCIWYMKHRCTIFHARVRPVGIPQKLHWDRLCRTCVLHPGRKTSMDNFSCSGGTGTNCTKTRQDTLRRTCVFASGGTCGSRSAFLCLRGAK
jgi:hypothetical protein